MRIVMTCLAMLAASPLAHAQCSATTSGARAHLVELYTSEGCSSCPPADRWLGALPADASLVALAFHVDYWDSPDWKDRFADPRFTQRQRALAAQSGSVTVYTPEVALDGREWRDWSSGRTPAAIATRTPSLVVHVDSAQPLQVRADVMPAAGDDAGAYRVYFAISEDKLSSRVRGGENRGAELHSEHVVRAFAGPLPLAQAHAAIDVPADVRREHASVVAFVQRVAGGEVANVVRLPLSQCARAARG